MSGQLLPTHHCFDDAMNFIASLFAGGEDLDAVYLVHALCSRPDGRSYAHAWVEDRQTGRAFFAALDAGELVYLAASRDEYEAALGIREAVRYTGAEAVRLHVQHESCGPWLDIFIQACANGDRTTWSLEGGIEC